MASSEHSELELEQYLQDSGVNVILKSLVAQMCINRPRPAQPVAFMLDFLRNNYLSAEQQRERDRVELGSSTIFLNSSNGGSGTASPAASSDDAPQLHDSARLRQARDRRRRGAISAESIKEVDLDQEPVSFVPKSDETKERLERALRTNVLFSHLEERERQDVFDVMFEVTFGAGATIIEQGDPNGDHFYVVDEGECDIFVNGTPVQHVTPGGSFGELALIHGTPRAATVKVP